MNEVVDARTPFHPMTELYVGHHPAPKRTMHAGFIVAGVIAAVLGLLSIVPQIIQIKATKNSCGLNRDFVVLVVFTQVLWVVYGTGIWYATGDFTIFVSGLIAMGLAGYLLNLQVMHSGDCDAK